MLGLCALLDLKMRRFAGFLVWDVVAICDVVISWFVVLLVGLV